MKKLFFLFLVVLSFMASYSQPWSGLPGGSLNSPPSTMISFGGYRWFSGGFSNSIARHNGVGWVATPPLTGQITSFCIWNGVLYGAGVFEVGPIRYGAVKWNGTGWEYFGIIPFGFYFNSITVFNNQLVFGGRSPFVDGLPISHLAKWDGAVWSAFPLTIICSWLTLPNIRVVKEINGYLHVGGDFNYVNGIPSGLAFKTDGTSVIPMGLEWNYYVADFAKYHDSVFCTGNFPFGPFPANEGSPGIVKTNDATWYQVGHGLKMRGLSMTTSLTDLYVGGYYNNTCYNTPCNHADVGNLGKWNGNNWSNESSGLFNQGNEVVNFLYYDTLTNKMYAIGSFHTSLGDVADFVAVRQLTVVPIRLSKFLANYKNGYVTLNWRDETPSDGVLVEIQRSTDGTLFKTFASSTEQSYFKDYSFTFKEENCKKLFFRLAFEGRYSDIRSVDIPCPGPKIIAGKQVLTIDTKTPVTLIVMSTTGQVLVKTVLTRGYQQIPLNVSPGVYFIRAIDQKGNVFSKKIFIQ